MLLYRAYGVTLSSEVPLPELPEVAHLATPDVEVCLGDIALPPLTPTSTNRQGIQVQYGGTFEDAYLYWPGVAKFRAIGGQTLVVEPDSISPEARLLNLYLLSEALGLVLMQRGLFLLHASAIQVGTRAALFAGAGGAGKSTTAAAFARRSYPVLADDMAAICLEPTGKATVIPSFPQLKIWPRTAEGLGLDLSSLPTLFTGSRKRVLRPRAEFLQEPVALHAIFLLQAGSSLTITPAAGPELIPTLTQFFSCPLGLLEGEALSQYFQQCTHLIDQVPIWTLTHPKTFSDLERLVEQVIHLLAGAPIGTVSEARSRRS